MASADLRDELTCSICLSIYSDPVTLPCGHNFCQVCITNVLGAQDASRVYICPECRTQLLERPSLKKNTTISNIAESFVSANPEQEVFGILCSNCLHASILAVKTCLLCEVNLCANHVKVHNKSPDHVLIEPTTSLKNRKCPTHNEVLRYYCSVDSTFVCASCSLIGPHKGHQLDPLEKVSEEEKKQLRCSIEKLTSKRKETEIEIRTLQDHRTMEQNHSSVLTEKVIDLIRDVKGCLDALQNQALDEICRQNVKTSAKISCLIQELDTEKKGLSKRIGNLEDLCNQTDPLSFLQRLKSNRDDGSDIGNNNKHVVNKMVYSEKVQISKLVHKGFEDIMAEAVKQLDVLEASNIVLDVDTAGNNVALSANQKAASSTKIDQDRPETPGRFYYCQVLSINKFSTGHHYWEVDASKSEFWRIGVAYPSMDRKGDKTYIGYNNKSWCLRRWGNEYSAIHDGKVTGIPYMASVGIFRVCLNYNNGILSFYELCMPIKHIYTYNATFTEPVHAALFVLDGMLKLLT